MFCRAAREGRPAFPFVFENLHRQRANLFATLHYPASQHLSTDTSSLCNFEFTLGFIFKVIRLLGKVLRSLRL